MDLILKIKEKDKVFKNKEVTFGTFEKAIEFQKLMSDGKFLGDNYPLSELKDAKEFICEYFGVTTNQFNEGFIMRDGIDFFTLFNAVLYNIQVDDGRRKVDKDNEGK